MRMFALSAVAMLLASVAAAQNSWPSAASITVPAALEEKQFLNTPMCFDDSVCFGPRHFEKFILTKYPDIGKIRFSPPRDVPLERDEVARMREDFRRGLYYAKLIPLANGQTLFEFLTKCSKHLSPLNWAQVDFEAKGRTPYVSMQFFPVLKRKGTGEEIEMQILLDRHGDRIDARSPLFSTNALRYSNFLDRHGLECW